MSANKKADICNKWQENGIGIRFVDSSHFYWTNMSKYHTKLIKENLNAG